MAFKITGNTHGLRPQALKELERLYRRTIEPEQIVSPELALELSELASDLRRRIGILVTREGEIEQVFVGTNEILYLPDLGRYRLGRGRLRRLRLIFTDLGKVNKPPALPNDIMGDLERLRLDAVVGVKTIGKSPAMRLAYLLPPTDGLLSPDKVAVHSESVEDIRTYSKNFIELIESVESEWESATEEVRKLGDRVVLVGVYSGNGPEAAASMDELEELARTAGVKVVERIIQRREPDPKTVLGRGKLEEVLLRCVRLDAGILIFDGELKPTQWRAVTNATEMKILDRSMLILDIFAQRATSADGRLQVELAQLKYSLPRLVEQDSGLSRLSGGIGGRGPGETKLEVSRRRIRDRIADLEKRINKLAEQRQLRRGNLQQKEIPILALVGYTNVGKSTLFNRLTGGDVLVEDKLFATLDPAKRRCHLVRPDGAPQQVVLSDTVGFIRDLPKELVSAFRATLEELSQATLLLHVIDVSDPQLEQHHRAVRKILEEMQLSEIPLLTILNKADKVTTEVADNLCVDYDATGVSAISGQGLPKLREQLLEALGVAHQKKALASEDYRISSQE